MGMSSSSEQLHFTGNEIAIIGMAGRFPKARDLEEFWQNLCDGQEAITFFSPEELVSAGLDPVLLNDPHYVPARAILEDIDLFDARFFGYSPGEAEILDPQQRLFLEAAWQALENAGYNAHAYDGWIGVYAGLSINTYLLVNLHSHLDFQRFADNFRIAIANDKDYLSTRVSYKLHLRGPSVTVQTACSTSLVAVHLASQSLLSGECDMALAGGVSIQVPQKMGYLYQEGGIASPDGHCRAFDAKAQGTLGGDGLGVVVLKRLADALADRDHIHAIIKGTACNNDGANKVGYTAPSVQGQAEVISQALAMAGIGAQRVSYVETHGTGTPLGDPIEIAALKQAYETTPSRKGFCAIGSVKTNIGHTDAAAGIAGLLKTVLALEHERIPPSLHFETPNPEIDFTSSPFYVNTSLSPWNRGNSPRVAAVSSFGIGGTNAHVVLEEAPLLEASGAARPWQLLLLSARTSSALQRALANLAEHLKQHTQLNLADVAYTLHVGRKAFEHRYALVCRTLNEAVTALESAGERETSIISHEVSARLVFMFPGGGTQYVNMGRELYETEPVFRTHIDACIDLLKSLSGFDLLPLLYPGEDDVESASSQLSRPSLALQALFIIEYALAQLWISWGITPQVLIGHSLGEYVAACLAGVFSLEDALAVVLRRGQLFEQLPEGAMLSVALPEEEVRAMLNEKLSLAAVNGSSHCVISGATKDIEGIEALLKDKNIDVRRLHIGVAAHSVVVEPVLREFTEFIRTLSLQPPSTPYLSNVTGTWITAAQATDPAYWARHLRQTVRFADGLQELLKEPGQVLLEVGPGHALSALASLQADPSLQQTVLASMRHPYDQQSETAFLLTTAGRLWQEGISIDGALFYANQRRHRIPLPTYPFERQRYWVEPYQHGERGKDVTDELIPGKRAKIADWFYIPAWKRTLPCRRVAAPATHTHCWLIFVDGYGLGTRLAEVLEQGGQDVVLVRMSEHFSKITDRAYTLNAERGEDYAALLKELSLQGRVPQKIVHCWSLTPAAPPQRGISLFKRVQSSGYYSLLFLGQALEVVKISTPLDITVISNYLYDTGHTEVFYPEKATLLGPCMVLPQEYQQVRCRCIDIALPKPESYWMERLLEQLVAEMNSSLIDLSVVYRGNQRWIRTYEPVQLEQRDADLVRLRERGVYLIVGGLGNIGLQLAAYLGRTSNARLVLLSRSALPSSKDWQKWLLTHDEQDSTSRKIRKIEALETAGIEVMVVNADIASEESMREVIEQIDARFGELHAVIHAAGITQGKSIYRPMKEIGQAESEEQFRAKVDGLYALEKVLRGRQLDFCLLFSSNASILGGWGFAAYAAAHLFMDAFVARQNKIGNTVWLSVNWDGWPVEDDPKQQKRIYTSMDTYAMQPAESIEALRRVLSAAELGQVVVSTGELLARYNLWIRREASQRDTSSHQSLSLHARPPLLTHYQPPRTPIEETLVDIWGKLLGIEKIGIHDNFFTLGGHSLLATQVISWIRKLFQVEIPLSQLFESPTIAELAPALVQNPTGTQRRLQEVQPDDEHLLAMLNQLSEEEIDEFLNDLLTENEANT